MSERRCNPGKFNARGAGKLPGHLGIVFTRVAPHEVMAELAVKELAMAPNGYLHAGSVVTLADTCCGYGCFAQSAGRARPGSRPSSSNRIIWARRSRAPSSSRATPVHLGRTTQVWDAVVTHKETGKTIALFRCTQMILYPK